MKQSLKRGLVMLAAFAGVVCPFAVHATDYTYSNVDSDSLAVKSDGMFGTTSFSFQLSNPSANAGAADFPASGYVQLTSISISARSDNNYQTVTTATLTNNKTAESYTATVTYSEGNDFVAVSPTAWERKEVLLTFATDGVLVDTTATYTLTFKNSSGTVTTLGYSVVTTVASNTQTEDWKPAMRIYGRTPSGSMEMPSSLIPSTGGVSLPSTVTVANATGIAFANDSVTIPNSGVQVAFSSSINNNTVMVKAIIPSSGRLIAWKVSGDLEAYTSYTGSQFEQHYLNKGSVAGTYGTSAWTRDASEHWLAVSYARKDNEAQQSAGGTRTYLDGVEKITNTGLKWSSLQTSKITIGGAAYNTTDVATGMVVKDVQIYSDALTAEQVATVTAALNKGWTVDAAGTTLTTTTLRELPNHANVQAFGSLNVAADGTYSASDQTEVKVLAGGSFDIGTSRPTISGVAAGGTLAVASGATMSDRIAGYTPTATLTVTGDLGGTVTLDGETVTPSIEGATATLTGTPVAANPTYTGNGWWWDYEFTGNGNNIGSDGVNLSWDGDRPLQGSEYTTADETGNQMLHLPARPWRNVTAYPSEFTAVMFCKAGATANGVLVAFGSTAYGSFKNTITLSTGANPSAGQMRLVYGSGQNSSTDLVEGGFTLDNITSANHLYAFTVKTVGGVSQIAVYADGDLLTTYTADSVISLGTGFQIASGHGGLPSGLSRLANDDAATMDFLRVSNVALSDAAIKALAAEYRYVSPNGIAERTLSANATWTDEDNTSWAQKTLNVDGSSTTTEQAAPNSGTVVEITATADVQLTMDLVSEVSYEKLTFQGSGAITVKAGGTAPTVTTHTYINTDVTMDVAAFASLGAITVAASKTLTIVPDEQSAYVTGRGLGIRGIASTTVTGTVTLETGAQVVLSPSIVDALATYGFTLTLTPDASNRYVYNIARDDNPVHITKAVGGTVTYEMYPDTLAIWQMAGWTLPEEPATIPEDFASSVTIVNNHASDSLTVATVFAGGNLTVSSGTVILTGDITTSGTVALNSATTLSGNNTVSSALTGSGAVTIDGTVTLEGSIANTINGSGTLVLSSIPKTLSFGTWTGTVVLPKLDSIAGNAFSFNDYGVTGSTVRVNGIGGGWLRNEEVNPTIDIPEGKTLTISAFSPSFNNTFKKLSGAGTFAVTHSAAVDTTAGDWYENYSAYYLIKDVSGFTGSLSTATPGIAIGSSKPGYQTAGGKIALLQTATVGSGATWTAPDGVTVASGVALKGEGTIAGAVTFASGATLDTTAGVPTVTGAVMLGDTLNVEMDEGFTPAAYTGGDDQKALSASASGLKADTVLTAATVKAAGSTLDNAVLLVKADGLYAVKPTVPTSGDDVPAGVTSDVAEAIAKKAAVAGVGTVTYKTTGDDSFSADRAILFPETLAVNAKGEVSTTRPTFGIQAMTAVSLVEESTPVHYIVVAAKAVNLADGATVVLNDTAADEPYGALDSAGITALGLTNSQRTTLGVGEENVFLFRVPLGGASHAFTVTATNE